MAVVAKLTAVELPEYFLIWEDIEYPVKFNGEFAAIVYKSIMIYGVVAIAVMASLWGLVSYLQSTVGVTAGGSITVPTIPNL